MVAAGFRSGSGDEQTQFGNRVRELEIGRARGLIGIDRVRRGRHDPAAGWGLALVGFAVAGCRPNRAVTLGRGSDPTCRLHSL
jgi:hypothetical protein